VSEKSIKPCAGPYDYDVFGDWEYVLDDTGVSYGPGWWPFVDSDTNEPTAIRVSPDWAFYAWGSEYALLWCEGGSVVTARISVYALINDMRPNDLAGTLALDIKAGTFDLGDFRGDHEDQAVHKAERLLDFIKVNRSRRRKGLEPIHAYDAVTAKRGNQE
jgi:hypothetical protein